jgi:N-acetylmuramoyl-L-alanine amidase CwlA
MSSGRRASKGKEIRPTFFIFCEGATEEQYIKYLKSKYRVPFEIDSKIAGNRITSGYIKNYKDGKITDEKDKTFLLYDLDAPKMLEKLQDIKQCILLASNPSIELWFLLHFKEQKANIDSKKCTKSLILKSKSYKKGIIDTLLQRNLNNGQLKAVHRAKKLQAYNNPSSTVYKMIDELEKIKQ